MVAVLTMICAVPGCESDTAVVFVRSFSFKRDMDRGETVTREDLEEKELILSSDTVGPEGQAASNEVSGSELESLGDKLHITDGQLQSMLGKKLVRDVSEGTRLSEELLE